MRQWQSYCKNDNAKNLQTNQHGFKVKSLNSSVLFIKERTTKNKKGDFE
jgi:hypothetical protein